MRVTSMRWSYPVVVLLVRARKYSSSMTANEQAPCSTKKRRKESSFWQRKKEVAASLITSTARKRRIETATTSMCLVSPTRVRVVPGVAQTSVMGEESCRNLHLTFSSMDSSLADLKDGDAVVDNTAGRISDAQEEIVDEVVTENVTPLEESTLHTEPALTSQRSSILETIFSPVFHLFKGYGEEVSTSCQSSVEQTEPPEQRVESAEASATKWDDDSHQDLIMASCTTQITSSTEEVAVPRFDSCAALSPGEDHELSMKSSMDTAVVTLVDATGECIEWDQLGDKAAGEDERPVLDHVQVDADVLTSDDADLFLAVEHSKSLECNDEGSSEGEVVVEEEEFEDIDPYLFIKRLPSLAEVVSPCRPLLLPRQTRRSPPITLVLDLDETLVHSTLELCDDADFSFPVHFDFQEHMVFVRRRPHLQMFMERVAQLFEIIVFTASQSVYAEQLLNVLDPKRKLIRHRIFRDSCVFVRGNYLKDLTILGRDLSKVAIIDNSPQAYGFQVDNGIPIESWFEDRSDSALAGLLPFLETLVGVDDVRPIIAKRFNLRGKIAAAAELPYITNRGDPLDRFS